MQRERWELRAGDSLYPASLMDLEEPPRQLYGLGDPHALSEGQRISIVGARRPTPYGIAIAEMAGRVAADCNITVVSGGAMGCDAAALRSAHRIGGRTVVVPGTGADYIYPKSSRDVFEAAITSGGCVVSLEPWGTPPQRWAFPKRNRIIAALSNALIVTEAGVHSGTSSTADAAVTIGRNVYAIPGSIFSPESCGSNRLIGLGAAIIASEEDLEVRISLDYGVTRSSAPKHEQIEDRILATLVANPMRVDALTHKLDMNVTEMLRILSSYELAGLLERLPDGRWSPTRDAYLGNAMRNTAGHR